MGTLIVTIPLIIYLIIKITVFLRVSVVLILMDVLIKATGMPTTCRGALDGKCMVEEAIGNFA